MPHIELAPAKINLALHVLGRRLDGYHELDSIVAFANVADRLIFEPSQDWRLDIVGPFAADLASAEDNLVLKAARGFEAAFGAGRRYRITLEKNLPVASGIGGGSADAAATLRALASLGQASGDLSKLARRLGADVPVCLAGRTCRMRGSGERLDPWPGLSTLPAVLVNPLKPVATAQVFAKLALKPGDKAFAGLETGIDLAHCRNDLTASACAVEPPINDVLAALTAADDLRFARMSGSGATCFGIFSSPAAAQAAARDIGRDHREWWVVATAIG